VAFVRERTGAGPTWWSQASGESRGGGRGLEMLRDAGRYVVVGQYTDAGDVT
jgi:hypothetical protein